MDGANKTFLANPRLFIAQNVIVIREGRFSDLVGECLLDPSRGPRPGDRRERP